MLSDAQAACEWSFNWYCSGCAKIGARTTGTNGGFADRQSCEAARANMQSTMNSRGGGVNTVACQSSGACNAPVPQGSSSSPSGAPSSTPSYGTSAPDFDAAGEQRQREEARRRQEQLQQEQQARLERERQERARKDREDALNQMKGGSATTATIRGGSPGDLGLKGLPSRVEGGKFTAWHQLHCVAGVLEQTIAEMDKPAPNREVIRASAQQLGAVQIWDGAQPLCPRTPDPPAPYGESSLSGTSMLRFYGNVMRAVARDADRLDRALQMRGEGRATLSSRVDPVEQDKRRATDALKRHRALIAQVLADPAKATVLAAKPIRTEPPVPVVTGSDPCAGTVSCVMTASAGGIAWLQDKAWAARIWSNDPLHRVWLEDAFTFITLPLAVEAVLPLESRATASSVAAARGIGLESRTSASSVPAARAIEAARRVRPPELYYDFPRFYRGDEAPPIPKSVFREYPYYRVTPRTWYWHNAEDVFIPRSPDLDEKLQWVLKRGGP